MRKMVVTILILLIACTTTTAQSSTSPNYELITPRIVSAGGEANSSNYSLNNVTIGNLFGGKAESANYSLARFVTKEALIPNPPTLNPIKSPTNISTQTLSGTKDIDTSIYINGYEVVPLNNETNWNYSLTLNEGDNHLIITARNGYTLESKPAYITITLDTHPPFIVINNPIDGAIVYRSQVGVEGTIDGVPFSETKDLILGPNLISKEASDEAGNISYESIEVYLAREPLALPQ